MENTDETLRRMWHHNALVSFKDAYWALSSDEQVEFHKNWLARLRDISARPYTLCDTPLHTAIYHPTKETLALWK